MKIHSKISIPVELADVGGSLHDFVYSQIIRGHKRSYSKGTLTLNGLDPNTQPTFSQLTAMVQGGGYFEGIKLAIEFASAGAANALVPEGVRGATHIGEDDVEQRRTWIEWLRATNAHVITNGTVYVTKGVVGSSILNSTELTAIHAQAGVSVIEWSDAVERFGSEEYSVYEL